MYGKSFEDFSLFSILLLVEKKKKKRLSSVKNEELISRMENLLRTIHNFRQSWVGFLWKYILIVTCHYFDNCFNNWIVDLFNKLVAEGKIKFYYEDLHRKFLFFKYYKSYRNLKFVCATKIVKKREIILRKIYFSIMNEELIFKNEKSFDYLANSLLNLSLIFKEIDFSWYLSYCI